MTPDGACDRGSLYQFLVSHGGPERLTETVMEQLALVASLRSHVPRN